MQDCRCQVRIKVIRFDGVAYLTHWIAYPRVPVKGDYLILDVDNEWGGFVHRIELLPVSEDEEDANIVWVMIEDKNLDDYEWEDGLPGQRRQTLGKGIERYIEAGFTLQTRHTYRLGKACVKSEWHCDHP